MAENKEAIDDADLEDGEIETDEEIDEPPPKVEKTIDKSQSVESNAKRSKSESDDEIGKKSSKQFKQDYRKSSSATATSKSSGSNNKKHSTDSSVRKSNEGNHKIYIYLLKILYFKFSLNSELMLRAKWCMFGNNEISSMVIQSAMN